MLGMAGQVVGQERTSCAPAAKESSVLRHGLELLQSEASSNVDVESLAQMAKPTPCRERQLLMKALNHTDTAVSCYLGSLGQVTFSPSASASLPRNGGMVLTVFFKATPDFQVIVTIITTMPLF